MKEEFFTRIQKAVSALKKYESQNIQLFHHNDTDGISSGTILEASFKRAGFEIKRYSLEKPYPQVLEKIFKTKNKIIIFADFAGRIAPLISRLNKQQNLVIILDHHTAKPTNDEMVYNIDGDLYGFKGDRDISASVTCYLFAKELDAANIDLAHLAVLGAVGDGFYENGTLVSFNYQAVSEAVEQKSLKVIKDNSQERYLITINNQDYYCDELANKIDMLGAVAYYLGGVELGIKVCKTGISSEIEVQLRKLAQIKEALFNNEIVNLKNGGLHKEKYIEWIDVGYRFSPMGVKMIGVFCNELRNSDLVDHTKYLAGFQTIPDEIPGFGEIEFDQTKISMRVSTLLENKIKNSEKLALNNFLPAATEKLNGFVDACHGFAAATIVKCGEEKELIHEMEEILKKHSETN